MPLIRKGQFPGSDGREGMAAEGPWLSDTPGFQQNGGCLSSASAGLIYMPRLFRSKEVGGRLEQATYSRGAAGCVVVAMATDAT